MEAWKPTCAELDNALGLGIYDGMKDEKEAQLFRTLLIEAAGVSHLRQLYEVFGAEILLKFFDLFAGVTLTVPSRNTIEKAIRDTRIFFLLDRAKTGHRAEQARELAAEYGLAISSVTTTYFRIRKRSEKERELQCLLKSNET